MFGGPSFKLFSLFGFRIGAHWTLPLALILAGVTYGGVAGVLLSVLLFASVLAHELGHALVARARRVPIAGIDLHMFGGVAKMAAPPRSPNDEIAIAAAGPAVSAALAAGAFALNALFPSNILLWLASANAMLFVFNLLPALPLDGGRVFRAFLAKRRGLVGGTRVAVTVSRVLAVGLGIAGIASSPWLIALAVMIWVMGSAELQQVARHDAMTRMGFWHPAHVPWARYDATCGVSPGPEALRRNGRRGSAGGGEYDDAAAAERAQRGATLEPDAVYPSYTPRA